MENTSPTHRYKEMSSTWKAAVVLNTKKVALTVIFAANVAALGAVAAYIILYCPFPTEALIASPFFAGVIGSLVYMGYPTFEVTRHNYTDYSNPVALAGKVTTYVLFGPVMLGIRYLDLTNYRDPVVASNVVEALKEKDFEEVVRQSNGGNFKNLEAHGIIGSDQREQLEKKYDKFTKQSYRAQASTTAKVETKWKGFQKEDLPQIEAKPPESWLGLKWWQFKTWVPRPVKKAPS